MQYLIGLVESYFSSLSEKFLTGQAREHAYRPVFESLIHSLDVSLKIVNDPSRSEHGNPDFVFLRGDITVGYTETKDIGVNLDETEKSEQMERYLGYSNLILTDYLEFRFFKNGARYGESIRIGSVVSGKLIASPKAFGTLADALSDFLKGEPEPIKSGKRLAEIMGGKARRIRDNIRQFLATESDRNAELVRVYQTIKKLLVHDLAPDAFADMYAQTLVYGLFVARYHDKTQKDFSRQEARDLIPASNPFLQHFFDHIAGPNFDKRLGYIVNELCDVFSCADVSALMHQYFSKNSNVGGADPVIHFYEDFLKEYDSEQRKKLGAFYTPLPVVRFIIRAVDYVLENDFGLAKGLADTEKNAVTVTVQGKKVKEKIHRVQILDPAVGTGTFLNEAIRLIHTRFTDQAGRWKAYVDDDLLPRLYGFELMMTPYTIAHLKLSMMLRETGYETFNKRLGIYLTNSLEEGVQIGDDLFSSLGLLETIAHEADEAGRIKREKPIMVIVGNPPYSGVSSNETDYANRLVEKYKVEPGGKIKLQERKHWLNDDYVKFIAFAEDMIEKNGEGIVAMITNNGYLDNPTFRGMRWHLLQTFDSIYVLDLHGNAKKKETTETSGKDENVFDIQQGVAILLAVKIGSKKRGVNVFRADIKGLRTEKYEFLDKHLMSNVVWKKVSPGEPEYLFAVDDGASVRGEYEKGFLLGELFIESVSGIVTARDALVIDASKEALTRRITMFADLSRSDSEVRQEFFGRKKSGKYLSGDTRGWKLGEARKSIASNDHDSLVQRIAYRPFDLRWIYYDSHMVDWGREKLMYNFLRGDNIGLVCVRQVKTSKNFQHVFVANSIVESTLISNRTSEIDYVYPLYLYKNGERIVNLNADVVRAVEGIVGVTTPEDMFDYVYAMLRSVVYCQKFSNLLKRDFPRVPYPKDAKQFTALVSLGRELRKLHLLESPKVNNFITTYPNDGTNIVESVDYKGSNVYLNKEQYFGGVPEAAWNFWIGSYQPAQKWLKDRKGSSLTNADIEHYQKIIVTLVETQKLITKIDEVIGG